METMVHSRIAVLSLLILWSTSNANKNLDHKKPYFPFIIKSLGAASQHLLRQVDDNIWWYKISTYFCVRQILRPTFGLGWWVSKYTEWCRHCYYWFSSPPPYQTGTLFRPMRSDIFGFSTNQRRALIDLTRNRVEKVNSFQVGVSVVEIQRREELKIEGFNVVRKS